MCLNSKYLITTYISKREIEVEDKVDAFDNYIFAYAKSGLRTL